MTQFNDDEQHSREPGKSDEPAFAVHHVNLCPDEGGSLSELKSILQAHMDEQPDQALLLLGPGVELGDDAARMLGQLLEHAVPGDVFTALSNAQPDMNPFGGLTPLPPDELDAASLVALLGTGELHQVHRLPDHLVLFPENTVDLLADTLSHQATTLDDLLPENTRVLVDDRIFVQTETLPLDHSSRLEPHEDSRPAPWGYLNHRIDQWCADPIWLATHAEQLQSFNQAASAGRAANLHITHSWGGGVERWVESFITADEENLQFQLRSEGPRSGDGAGQRLSLYAGNMLKHPLASWWLEPVITSTANSHEQYAEILDYITSRYGVSRVIVSSLVGHSLDSLKLDIPTIEVLHDFYPAWPLLDIHPQGYLGEDGADLPRAMASHALLPDFRGRSAEDWLVLGRHWHEVVQKSGIPLVAPSQSVANLIPALYPEFEDLSPRVIPHGISEPWEETEWDFKPRKDGRLRLLIPGRIQKGKGKQLLLKALPELRKHARIYLVGCGKEGEDFFGESDVDVILNYKREDLPRLIAEIGPDVAALLSTVPETFSYMLSELRELRVPVVATRVGSFVERIEDGVNGWLIDPDPEGLLEKTAWLKDSHDQLETMRNRLADASGRSTADMVADYEALLAPAQQQSAHKALTFPGFAQGGAMAAITTDKTRKIGQLERKLEESKADVKERTRWAKERDRVLEKEREENAQWVAGLEQDIQNQIRAHKETQESLRLTYEQLGDLQARYDAVLGSSSWAITRPLRVARRLVSNFMRARAWNPLRWPLLISQFVRTVSTLGWRNAVMRFQNAQLKEAPRGLGTIELENVGDPEPPASIPTTEKPVVSIVIPVHNEWVFTAACLRSIVEAENNTAYEVIVVDDASSDETSERLKGIQGLKVLNNPKNLGFIGTCNRGAAMATGDFVVFLNNDTQVMDGWLDHLATTFREYPDTGIAGARLVYPDGTLQECGGMIFSDGSGWNYGRGDDPDRPEYQFTREVDYCSGACIMIRREVFDELDGFDSHFAPAYYEDTDLAFRVREMGLKVRVQPAATVVHHEGITSGTDINSGAKRYQAVNQEKFLKRWAHELKTHPAPVTNPDHRNEVRAARDHRLKGRVLVIDAYTPEPDQDSGSLRMRYLMDCLFDLGYGVTFFPDNRSRARRYTTELQNAGVEAWYHPWLDSLHVWFNEYGKDFDYVFVCRHYVAINYIKLIRRYCPNAKFIFDTIDLHYLREQRLAELEDSLPLRRSAEQTRRSELSVIRDADATVVVSQTEVELLKKDAPGEAVHIISNIHQVTGSQNPFDRRKDVFFVGGFQHPPNIDAAQWFCGSVWPLIREELPDLQFHLIGSKAPDQIAALHGDGVVFHGFVPRLEPYLDGCRISVAPLRYGAGVKGKVNMSMSRGQPVVATPAAVEGLFAHDGEDVLVASEPQEFADAVVRLYQDEELWNRLSENGVKNVENYFSLDTARKNIKSVLESFDD